MVKTITPPSEYSAPCVEVLSMSVEQAIFQASGYGAAGAAGASLEDLYDGEGYEY